MIIKLGELLGRGGFGNVYRVMDPKDSTPLPIAVKRSRVSQRIRRPRLQHEMHLLHALQGHLAIPRVIAYGHLPHFEYLAMELLGKTLEEVTPKDGMDDRTVALIAVQLLSALEYIHSHGIIHRDIKPSNILLSLDQRPTLRIIDFGISRPFRKSSSSVPRDPIQERQNIPGTLHWVSLNTHLGYDTSRRDDIESLAFTLLFLLRGNMPWQRYNIRSGTLFGTMKQVREKKKQWTGKRLGEGKAKEFGELLDYARALEFGSKPDYSVLKKGFLRLVGNQAEVLDISSVTAEVVLPPPSCPQPSLPEFGNKPDNVILKNGFSWLVSSQTEGIETPSVTVEVVPSPPCAQPPPILAPVSHGQLIYVKLLSRITIEGYTAQATDVSHWQDTSLLGNEWETKKRPAVVLEVYCRKGAKYSGVKVLPLRRAVCGSLGDDSAMMRVSPQNIESGANDQWPWKNIVAFACPNAETFYCLPDQAVLTPGRWSVPASACEALSQQFDKRLHRSSRSLDDQLRFRIQSKTICNIYAALSPLEDPYNEATQSDVEWDGDRGWFDEVVRVARRRVYEDGQCWSTSEQGGLVNENQTEDAPLDSNSNPYTEWWPQGGREVSLTLDKEDKGGRDTGEKGLDQSIEEIKVVLRDGDVAVSL